MGIGSNLGVEIAEENYREALKREVIKEAAIQVVEGNSRESAFENAQVLINSQQEAISNGQYSEDEETNTIVFVDPSLEGSRVPGGKIHQVRAIEKELYDQFESDL